MSTDNRYTELVELMHRNNVLAEDIPVIRIEIFNALSSSTKLLRDLTNMGSREIDRYILCRTKPDNSSDIVHLLTVDTALHVRYSELISHL